MDDIPNFTILDDYLCLVVMTFIMLGGTTLIWYSIKYMRVMVRIVIGKIRDKIGGKNLLS